jgi:hypothetical protein
MAWSASAAASSMAMASSTRGSVATVWNTAPARPARTPMSSAASTIVRGRVKSKRANTVDPPSSDWSRRRDQ